MHNLKFYLAYILLVIVHGFIVTFPLIFVVGLLDPNINELYYHPAYILGRLF